MRNCASCGTSLSTAIPWCGQCYQPILPYRSVVAAAAPGRTVRHRGPTAFGVIGRLLITGLVAGVGMGLRAAVAAWTDSVGRAGGALGFVALGLYVALAASVLWATWKPARTSRTIYVDGPLVQVMPVRRRADDGRTPWS